MEDHELLRIPEDAGAHRPLWEKVFSTATLDAFRQVNGRNPDSREELVKHFPQLMHMHQRHTAELRT